MASSLIFKQTEQELTKKMYINNMRENYPRISFSLNPLCCLEEKRNTSTSKRQSKDEFLLLYFFINKNFVHSYYIVLNNKR